MALKFYTNVAKRLKLKVRKVRKFLGLILTSVEVTEGDRSYRWGILNRVKLYFTQYHSSEIYTYAHVSFRKNVLKQYSKSSCATDLTKTLAGRFF